MAIIKDGRASGTNQLGVDANYRAFCGLYDNSGNPITSSNPLPVSVSGGGTQLSELVDSTGTAIGNLNVGSGINCINVAQGGCNFLYSTANVTTTQLASGATYTGTIEPIVNQVAGSYLVTSDQPGVFTINQYIDAAGTRSLPALSFTISAGVAFARSIVLNGNYTNVTFKNTGLSTTTTLNVNVAYGDIPGASELGNAQVSVDEVAGVAMSARPDGFMRVVIDPTTLLYDSFDTFDTTNVWTPGGTVTPSISTGMLQMPTSTTAGATSYVSSIAKFYPGSSAYLQMASVVQIEAGTVTNSKRFWGLGTYAGGAPTYTVPVSNGSVFELDGATGNLFASVYGNSVRTQTTTIVRPNDGGYHRYALYYKQSRVYFEVDNVIVATFGFPNAAITSAQVVSGSVNNTTAPSAAPVLNVSLLGVADTGKNSAKLSDGLFPWRQATVKPGTLTPTTADNALIVGGMGAAGAPASGVVSVQVPDTSSTATLAAANATATIAMAGSRTCGFSIPASSTLVATLVPQASFDGGTTWTTTLFDDPVTSVKQGSLATASGTSYMKTIVPVGGCSHLRVLVSAYTSGTATATIHASQVDDPSVLFTTVPGNAVPQDAAFVGGSDGTYLRALNVDYQGRLNTNMESNKASYSASIVGLAAVSTTATDIFTITGSASKTVRITRVTVDATLTTAAVITVQLVKRSTANSSGTSASVTATPHDSNSAAASATVLSYTANPTVGTQVGSPVRAAKVTAPTTSSTTALDHIVWDFGVRPSQTVVLRGTTQVLAVNLNSASLTGATFNITYEWVEDNS